MRICLYSESAPPMVGGQSLVIDALARQFLAAGHEATVLAIKKRHHGPVSDHLLPYAIIRHHRFLSTRYLLDYYRRFLSQVYREHRFDVLHCHNVYPAGYVAARWCESRGVPLVITSHGGSISPDSRMLTKPRVPARIAYVLGQAAALVAISDVVERRYLWHCPRASRIARIPNGVEFNAYAAPAPRPAGIPPSLRPQGYFLFLGRLIRRKGADLLLDAYQRIAGEVAARLVIAGAGEEETALKTRAAQLGLADRVYFPGVVGGMEKIYLLQNCLASVVPSRIVESSSPAACEGCSVDNDRGARQLAGEEASPLVIIESHAAGAAVIGARIPGLADAILHDRTGIVVPPDNARELAAAMARLANDREFARLLGQSGREEAEKSDWRLVADRHLDIYAAAITRQRGRLETGQNAIVDSVGRLGKP